MRFFPLVALALVSQISAAALPDFGDDEPPAERAVAAPQPATPLRLMFNNDMTDGTSGFASKLSYMLLTTPVANTSAIAACAAFNETLATGAVTNGKTVDVGLMRYMDYAAYLGLATKGTGWWVAGLNGARAPAALFNDGPGAAKRLLARPGNMFAVLCTNSAPRLTNSVRSNTLGRFTVRATSPSGAQWRGYRDKLSFRFHAVPISTSQRFTPSTPITPSGLVNAVDDRSPRRSCVNANNNGVEDCLTASIFTPYLPVTTPALRNTSSLLPCMVWWHGGNLEVGTGSDPQFDGGNIVARSDVVVINPNYRLATLGWLPIPGTTGEVGGGNYALSDAISALKWVQANIASFGGDPTKVTIAGQSAGGRMIEALMRSPAAEGLYHRAIIQSGRPADAANDYLTGEQQKKDVDSVMNDVGCGGLTGSAALTCLNGVTAAKFTTGVSSFKNFTVDGNYIKDRKLDVARKYGGFVSSVPVIFGWQRDESGALGYVPTRTSAGNFTAELIKGGMRQPQIDAILSRPDLFPATDNATIQTTVVQVQTDFNRVSRCGLEATVFAAAQSGVFPAVYAYTYDQRGRQLPGLAGPDGVCGTPSAADSKFLCHNGDLYPTFNSGAFALGQGPRDNNDVVHAALVSDSWASFMRTGQPNPDVAYLRARGYDTAISRMWQPTTTANPQMLSLGPAPRMIPLTQRGEHCTVLGKPLNYVALGG